MPASTIPGDLSRRTPLTRGATTLPTVTTPSDWTGPTSSPSLTIRIDPHSVLSMLRDEHRRVGGGSPRRRDLEHLTPSPNPTVRSLRSQWPSLSPLTSIMLPTSQTLPDSENPLLVYTPLPIHMPQRRLEAAPTMPLPLSRSSSQTESDNHPSSDTVMETLPMISTPIPRRQIAFEQDSKMSPPLERERYPYEYIYRRPTGIDTASDQNETGSTMDLIRVTRKMWSLRQKNIKILNRNLHGSGGSQMDLL